LLPHVKKKVGTLRRTVELTTARNSVYAEGVAALQTSILQLGFQGGRASMVVMITSALPFEGKSTTATALAALIASSGKRVLLIDADLRAPRLHQMFGITTARGLTDCLEPGRDLNDSIYRDHKTAISLLPAGPPCKDPQSVLRCGAFRDALEAWRQTYDFIVVDSPPVLPVSDARVLAPIVDYCVMVVRWGRTRWTSIAQALRSVEESGGTAAGIVISDVDLNLLATYEFADAEVYGRPNRRYIAAAAGR
jgi:succinoglycan biosynthesis transport protein ExoP